GAERRTSRPAADPRHQSRREPETPRPLGAGRYRRVGREGPAGATGRPQPAGSNLGVRLVADDGRPPAEAVSRLRDMAGAGPSRDGPRLERSPLVRLYLASALQRVPVAERWPMAEALIHNREYASSHNHTLL